MKLASVLTPLSDDNLTLAAQCGVEQVVVRYPGPDLTEFDRLQARIRSFGMEIGAVEGYLPIDRIKLGTDDGTDLSAVQRLVRHLGGLDDPRRVAGARRGNRVVVGTIEPVAQADLGSAVDDGHARSSGRSRLGRIPFT